MLYIEMCLPCCSQVNPQTISRMFLRLRGNSAASRPILPPCIASESAGGLCGPVYLPKPTWLRAGSLTCPN